MEKITFNEASELEDTLFIDVRTPKEFFADHITGAVNIPVLSDDERALVGTIYKKESQPKAVDTGIAFFSKRLPEITKKLRAYDGKRLIAYCWRGGMRSHAFVSFLRSCGFDIIQLDGGYKSFRKYVRESLYNFDIKPEIFSIYGMTGTGKTDLIKRLAPVSIDLEGLAGHRSSIFGHVGLAPRTQKMFENLLFEELKRVNDMPYIFLEGESRRIGNINLPDVIFSNMLKSKAINVTSDMSVRVQRIVEEYFDSDGKIDQIREVLNSRILNSRLGAKNIAIMKEHLQSGGYDELVLILLEKYYDPMYMHSQKKLHAFAECSSNDIERATREIKELASRVGCGHQ